MSTRSSDGQSGLSPEWYLDPAVYSFENKTLFSDNWWPVGYANELETPESVVVADLLGSSVLIVRRSPDSVRVFFNVCRHRGTSLCEADNRRRGTHLVCPYHGWKYDLDGQLVAAPNMHDVSGFDRQEFSLLEAECALWQGLILARNPPGPMESSRSSSHLSGKLPGEPAADCSDQQPKPLVQTLAPIVQRYGLESYRRVKTLTYQVAANWKLIFQNYNECYHCPSVHPQLTPFSDYRDSENDFDSGPVLGGPMQIRSAVETVSEDGRYCGTPNSRLEPQDRRAARYYSVFPSLLLSLFPDYAMIHRVVPVARDRTRIDCDFLFPPETADSPGFSPEKAWRFWDLTNRQDWEMCERVQRGIRTPGFQPSPYSNLESLLVAFDREYLDTMRRYGFQTP